MNADQEAEKILKDWPKDRPGTSIGARTDVLRTAVKDLILRALDVGYDEGYIDGRAAGWDAAVGREDRE